VKMHTLDAELWLPVEIDQVFAFFSDAGNLETLTPPWLQFQIVTPRPIVMQTGLHIDYKIRIHGVPIRWRSEITDWQPPLLFVDEQRHGPYKIWRHRHEFLQRDGGTVVRDHVDYLPRGWLCAPIVNRWLVAPDLRTIFTYRQKKIRELLAPQSLGASDQILIA
jgi:ligand-binding SRPBCC domain-containing protein